ncbi:MULTISPECIES: HAMP domain-containing sensor histidine kinase [Parabacteroides]|mgnify:CR=1 FL=1|uniref:tetratricopeptide repeat-containing sensor histidine kinase n=1 Tax=Parabacteroides leei TaxID=2939491 RepID=UPI00189B7E31|nr:HAMP domain-containing sensor histidine kinase [Parabacteroides goldsteinii]
MREIRKRLFIIFCFLGSFCLPVTLCGANDISDALSLDSLFAIAQANVQQQKGFEYATQLLEEAQRRKDRYQEANAMFCYVRYYYSKNTDSMYFWMQKALPLFRDQKRFVEYFRMKAWYIYILNRSMQNEEALKYVDDLKEEATSLNYPEGVEMANQALADFYLSNNLGEEGVALYEEVVHSMEMRNAPLIKRINIIRQLMNKALDPETRLKYVERLDDYIKICKGKGIEWLDDEMSIYYLEYVMHRHYAMEYIGRDKLKEALAHLQQARALLMKYGMYNYEIELKTIYGSYYQHSKQYNKALAIFDTLLPVWRQRNTMGSYLDMLDRKADVLLKIGRDREASQLYQEYAFLSDSLSKVRFYDKLAEMNAQHKVDKLEIKNKQMDLEVAQAHSQLLQMGGGAILLFILCCLLGYISYSRHRYGLQLKLAKEKAEEADRMKSTFLANMNHEIRTPLNAIVGFSQVLVDEDDQETRQEYANIIQSNNELLQRLITDVLDISKIESNTMALNYAVHDLPVLMKEIYNVIKLRMPENVKLELNECLPQFFYTDRNRLTQILTNLLTNAIKHTEKGFIRFGYEVTETDVVFSVEDSGEGIPEDKQEKIFSRFVQLDDWSKGVGLGLAICKGLITQMGGTIGVSSVFGEGSTFTVVLPLKKQ